MAEAQDVIKLSYYLTATIFYILKTSKQNKKKKNVLEEPQISTDSHILIQFEWL